MRRFFTISLLAILLFSFSAVPSEAAFISEITETAFNKAVIHSDSPVVVVFYSGSFRGKFGRAVDDYAKKKSPVKILKMEKGISPITVSKYKIRRNYTFVFFADGEEIARTSTINSTDELAEFIKFAREEYRKKTEADLDNEWKPERVKNAVDKELDDSYEKSK